jgi:hypothetical protein
MELIKVGKNTKNAESIKIPGNIKTAFKKYLKAQQTLNAEEYKEVKVELLFASWLATFEASEEYKTVIAAADAQAEAAKKEKEAAAEARKAEAAKAKAEKQAKKIADLEEALAKAKAEAEAKTEEAEAQE